MIVKRKPSYVELGNKYFKTAAYYIKHIRYHNDPPEKTSCNGCDTLFPSKIVLTNHMTLHRVLLGVLKD